MKKSKLAKEKCKLYSVRRKGVPGSVVELSSARGEKTYKENPGAKWDKGSSGLRAELHPARFPTCENDFKEADAVKETINNRKLKQT